MNKTMLISLLLLMVVIAFFIAWSGGDFAPVRFFTALAGGGAALGLVYVVELILKMDKSGNSDDVDQ